MTISLSFKKKVSNTIRDILLGHAPQSINERHYVNRKTIKLSEKVQQAHTEILDDFEFESLAMQLYVKMINYIDAKEMKGTMASLSEMKKLI